MHHRSYEKKKKKMARKHTMGWAGCSASFGMGMLETGISGSGTGCWTGIGADSISPATGAVTWFWIGSTAASDGATS